MSFCLKCQSISSQVFKRNQLSFGREVYKHDIDSFTNAVALDCFFCAQVYHRMSQEQKQTLISHGDGGEYVKLATLRPRAGSRERKASHENEEWAPTELIGN